MKEIKNGDNQLKEQIPILSSVEKKNVFSVPPGYFDSLPGEIMSRVSEAPALEEIKVSNPFKVPENYFERLPLSISNRISDEEKKTLFTPSLFPAAVYLLKQLLRPKYSLSFVTACFMLFFCIRYFEKPVRMNISSGADGIYVSEREVLDEVDEGVLLSAAREESGANISGNKKPTNGDKYLEDYIINNNIDLSDLANEL